MSFKRPFRAVPIQVGKRYRAKRRRQRHSIYPLAAAVLVATFAVGIVVTNDPIASASMTQLASIASIPRFKVCTGPVPRTCVVDGDTIWLEGEKIRIADIDTPEIGEAKCRSQHDRGILAPDRLAGLLNEGKFDVIPGGGRNEDQYGRKLRVLTRDGLSLGNVLVSEGLARTWSGQREPWC